MRSESILTLPLPFLVFISSTTLGSRKVKDKCIFKEGDKFPSFIRHVGDITDTIPCSNNTCLCNGSRTGYKDCQSCCCAIRERFKGNGSLKFESSYNSELYNDMLNISCFKDFKISSGNLTASVLEKISSYLNGLEKFYTSILVRFFGSDVRNIR